MKLVMLLTQLCSGLREVVSLAYLALSSSTCLLPLITPMSFLASKNTPKVIPPENRVLLHLLLLPAGL